MYGLNMILVKQVMDTWYLDSVEVASFCLFFDVDTRDVNVAVVDVIFEGFEAEGFIVQAKVIDCISACMTMGPLCLWQCFPFLFVTLLLFLLDICLLEKRSECLALARSKHVVEQLPWI